MTLVDRGVPMFGAERQQQMAVGMNASETQYDYLAQYWSNNGEKWNIVARDFTNAAVPELFEIECPAFPGPGSGSVYGQSGLSSTVARQLRAQNGRILLPQMHGYVNYYDPYTREIHTDVPRMEQTPPTAENAISGYYRGGPDSLGYFWLTTLEVGRRASCLVRVDPGVVEDPDLEIESVPPSQEIIGYFGDSAVASSVFGWDVAPDVETATPIVYTIYGQNPWQVWAVDVTTGVATKLIEVPGSAGAPSFVDVPGKGWTVQYRETAGGTLLRVWLLEGATHAYTAGVDPPVATRNVTPLTNPLPVDAPKIAASLNAGIIAYRFATSGPYTYKNYSINGAGNIVADALFPANDSIGGNGAAYAGFFRRISGEDDAYNWFGTYASFSQGPRINVDGIVWGAAYPQGAFVRWDPDPDVAYDAGSTSAFNPWRVGAFGAQGIQDAGIKHATSLAWVSDAGASGRFYATGPRERNGVGMGIGYYDVATNDFQGIYYDPDVPATDPWIDTDGTQPEGLVHLADAEQIVVSTKMLDEADGDARLFVFAYDLTILATLTPLEGRTELGPIFPTSTANVITGIVQGAGNTLGLWQYDVDAETLLDYVEIAEIVGELQVWALESSQGEYLAACRRPNGDVYLVSGTNLVRVDVDALTAEVVEDLSAIGGVTAMSFGADESTLWIATDEGKLWTHETSATTVVSGLTCEGTWGTLTFVNDGAASLVVTGLVGEGTWGEVSFRRGAATPSVGENLVQLRNVEGIAMTRGQPVYAIGGDEMRLARADGAATSVVIGVVAAASIADQDIGTIALHSVVRARASEWDAICGTTNGLVANTTYYLSTTAGRLTSTAPSGEGRVVPVIRALSSTEAVIAIQPPTLL